LANDALKSKCNQYWGYIILRTSMTSYAKNKVFDSQIRAYPILAKTHIVHGFA
jgi:hypothetical protein